MVERYAEKIKELEAENGRLRGLIDQWKEEEADWKETEKLLHTVNTYLTKRNQENKEEALAAHEMAADLRAEVERLRGLIEQWKAEEQDWKETEKRLRELVLRAASDSCVDGVAVGGPGCFYCDTEDGHTEDCEAAKALERRATP